MKRKTVGEESLKRLLNPEAQHVIDTEREVNKEYYKEISKCIDNHPNMKDPYYIVVLIKKERLMENVVRRYFIARESLPTPQWDQTVWRFDPSCGDLRFIWCLPDENTAKWMAGNTHEVPPEHYELLKFVLELLDKKLYDRFLEQFHKDDNVNKKVKLIF